MDSLPPFVRSVTYADFDEARREMLRVWALLSKEDRREAHNEANATAAALRGIAANEGGQS